MKTKWLKKQIKRYKGKPPIDIYIIIILSVMTILGIVFTFSGMVISGIIDLQEIYDSINS